MFDEMYTWLEEYSGTSYDFKEAIMEIDGNQPFLSPFNWRISIGLILDQLDDAMDVIDEYWKALPDTLPNRKDFKRILAEHTLRQIVNNVNGVCKQLNIDPPDIHTVDELREAVITLCELLDMLINHPIDEILKNDLYTEHEENNDDSFSEILDVQKQDMTQLSFNVNAIRQAYYEGLDEEDEVE